MDKKLTIIFKDGHINIGQINVIGVGICKYCLNQN